MKYLLSCLICLWFLLLPLPGAAQVTMLPKVEWQSLPNMRILRFEITRAYTMVNIIYTNPYEQGGLACAYTSFHIRPSGSQEKYTLIRAENIPVCPEQHHFTKKGQRLSFKLFFPRLPHSIYKVDIIEGNGENPFSFYGVSINNISPPTPAKPEKNAKQPPPAKEKTQVAKQTPKDPLPPVQPRKDHKPALSYNGKNLQVNENITINILFEHASDKILDESSEELNKLLSFLRKYPSLSIELIGHTEKDEPYYTREQKENNKKLSFERVGNVRDFLIRNGISPSRIEVKGMGGTQPVSKDPALNRRVVMKVLSY